VPSGEVKGENMSKTVTLNHELSGREPYQMQSKLIPKGTELLVDSWDHDLTDARVVWDGVTYLVNKDDLGTFRDHD
jgi:hypothetical protein